MLTPTIQYRLQTIGNNWAIFVHYVLLRLVPPTERGAFFVPATRSCDSFLRLVPPTERGHFCSLPLIERLGRREREILLT